MATVPLVSVEEYLHTSYRPDCDYIDGVVVERNLGQFDHSILQTLIIVMLSARAKEWGVRVLAELRLKVRERKYRIPDVMVISLDAPRTPVIETPPLLCIEVVSPDDRLPDLTERAKDYFALGAPQTWIFDPQKERAYVYSTAGLEEKDGIFRCRLVELDTNELFRAAKD